MSINLEYYKTFYYVVKYGKISAAADKLYVTQPAVTQTIQKLERELGANLLVRTKSGIELTEIGKKLYEFTQESIEILDNVEYRFNKYENLEEGNIKIRTGNYIAKSVLYDKLVIFGKEYPNIKIEISTGAPNESMKMLHSGEIDMMLVYLPFKVQYDNLLTTEIKKEKYVFAMSKKYYEDNSVKISSIEDLNKYSLILPKTGSAIRGFFDEKFKNKITNFHFELTNEEMKKDFIMKGLGIGFIVENEIKKEIKKGEIIELNIDNSYIEGSIGAITLNNKYASYATKKLLEFIKNK